MKSYLEMKNIAENGFTKKVKERKASEVQKDPKGRQRTRSQTSNQRETRIKQRTGLKAR